MKGFDSLFRFSVSFAIYTYRRILQQYRPGELSVFNRKYIQNWRKAFIEVPNLKYEDKMN